MIKCDACGKDVEYRQAFELGLHSHQCGDDLYSNLGESKYLCPDCAAKVEDEEIKWTFVYLA